MAQKATPGVSPGFRQDDSGSTRVRKLEEMAAAMQRQLRVLRGEIASLSGGASIGVFGHTSVMPDEHGTNGDHDKRYFRKARMRALMGSRFGVSKLVAPDGAPDPALSVTNAGRIGIAVASPNEDLEVAGRIRANTAFNTNGSNGISGTLTVDDGANWRFTLTFSGGILVGQSVGASSAATCTWV